MIFKIIIKKNEIMKNIINIAILSLFIPILTIAQNIDPCSSNWTPDHILDAPSSTYPDSYFTGKKIELKSGFKVDKNIIFDNCNVKVSINNISCSGSFSFKIKNSSLFKACDVEWRGFRTSTVDVEIENSFFLNFTGLLFLIEDKEFHFHNNFCQSTPDLTGIPTFQFKGQTDNFSFYGNNVITNSPTFWVISSKPLTIGDYNHNPNIFNSYHDGIIQNKLNTDLTVVNSKFYYVGYAINTYKARIDNCEFYRKDVVSDVFSYAIGSEMSLNVTNSKFNYSKTSIIHKGGNLSINSNIFNSNNTAIKIELASQNFASGFIENNNFTRNFIDIHSTGAFTDLSIARNNFSGKDYGILADGDNSYSITNNSFYNSYAGSIAYSNGTNANLNDGNQYNTLIGMHALENNGGFQFLENCFSTSGGDVYLDGSISGMIGDPEAEAGNCFSKGGTPDISASTNPFDYFRPASKIGTCKDPITLGTYTEEDANVKPIEPCGSGVIYTGSQRNYCKFNFKTLKCIDAKKLLADIDGDIALVKLSSSYQQKIKDNILLNLNRCRSKLLRFLMTCVDPKDEDPKLPDGGSGWTGSEPNMAATILKTSVDKYDRAAFIGLSISLGQISEAKSYIQAQIVEDQEMEDFKNVQLLNIRRHEDGNLFLATESELSLLQNIGQKSDPLAAYARGFYAQLTGETIYPPIPRIVFNRSKVLKSSYSEIEISPNPVSDLLTIRINNTEIQDIQVSICDITGRTVDQFNVINNNIDLNTVTWPKGIYIVKVLYEGGYNETKKVVKQ